MPKETFIPICNHLKYPNDGWIHMCIYCNAETSQYKEYKKIITNTNEKLYALMLCNKCQYKINTDIILWTEIMHQILALDSLDVLNLIFYRIDT